MDKEQFSAYKARLSKITNAPDLRMFMTSQTDELREFPVLREYFIKRLNHLKLNWNIYDSFFMKMLDDLEFDFEADMEIEYREVEGEIIERTTSYYKKEEKIADNNNVSISVHNHSMRLVDDVYYEAVKYALQNTFGNRSQASKLLGVSIRTLRNKMNEYKERGLITYNEIDYDNLTANQTKQMNKLKASQNHIVFSKTEVEEESEETSQDQLDKNQHIQSRAERLKEEKEHREKIIINSNNSPNPKHVFNYASCPHPKEFEWEDGLCFKCYKAQK